MAENQEESVCFQQRIVHLVKQMRLTNQLIRYKLILDTSVMSTMLELG